MPKFLMAALAATGLALAAISGAVAAPVAPIGKAADAIDARSTVHHYGCSYHRHHRHCWWRYGPQDLPLVMGPRPGAPERCARGSFFFEITPQSVRAKFKRLV